VLYWRKQSFLWKKHGFVVEFSRNVGLCRFVRSHGRSTSEVMQFE
jgi:hypothetical protein